MRRSNRPPRSGASMVEFALAAPVLMLLLFAAWDFSRANMLAHSATSASYEGCRRGIVPGATATDVQTAAASILDATFVRRADIAVAPQPITPATEKVTVTVRIPINQNSWTAPWFMKDRTIVSSVSLRRERLDAVSVP